MENQNIDRIILSFLQEEATANEIEILRKWMSDDKEHRSIFESVNLYWKNSTLSVSSSETDNAYKKLMSKSFKKSSEGIVDINFASKSILPHRLAGNFPWNKIAAALILFFTLAGSLYFIINTNKPVPEIVATTEIIKQNPKGQKLTTYLPDGSKVILNSLSEIRFTLPFVGKERIVIMKGEAFFEVKKDATKPFKVISNGVTTTALGTSFNVNCKNDNHVEVALVSGKVEVVDASMNSVILDPGESAIANQHGELKVQTFDSLDKTGWKDGILVFNDNSLPTILTKLEDWYGVEFIVDTSLFGQFHYTGNYKNESLEEVLQGISFVHQFEYKISGDTVKIYFNKTN